MTDRGERSEERAVTDLFDPMVDEDGVCLLCGGTGRYVSAHPPGALGIGHRYEGPCSCQIVAAGPEEGAR